MRVHHNSWQDNRALAGRSFGSLDLFQTVEPVWNRRMVDKGIEIMPGFFSDDPRVISFLTKTVDQLMEIYSEPDVLDDDTIGPSGVHEPVSRYKTITGYGSKPMSYTAIDNKLIREEKGLPNDWRRPRDRELFEQLCHCFFREIDMKNIKANRISTSGAPEFTTDYVKKIEWIDEILKIKNVGEVMKKVMKHDLEGLLRDHKLVIAYVVNKRRQEDLHSKERWVIDYLYAVTGGKKGKRFKANKDVVLSDSTIVKGFSAQRLRAVKGSPIRLTALLQPFAAGVRSSIAKRYAATYKHTTDEDSAEKLNKYAGAPFSTDYTEFDTTYPGFFRESMLKVMAFYFDPAIVELARLSFAAPYFQPAVYSVPANATPEQRAQLELDDPGRWVGNPLDIEDFIFNSGIVSGNPFVDIEGKLGGTFDAIVKWDYILGDMDKRMESFLEGADPLIGDRNQGDDNQAMSNDPALKADFIEKTLAKDDSGKYIYSYFAADREKGNIFTGKGVTWFNERGERTDRMRVIPRVAGVLRWFTNERAITAKTRQFWPVGFFERQSLYGQNPAWGNFWRTITENWSRETGTDLETLAASAYDATTMPRVNIRSAADLEVLLDSSKLDYLYTDEGVVSQEIADLFQGSPDFKQVEIYVATYYRGHIH